MNISSLQGCLSGPPQCLNLHNAEGLPLAALCPSSLPALAASHLVLTPVVSGLCPCNLNHTSICMAGAAELKASGMCLTLSSPWNIHLHTEIYTIYRSAYTLLTTSHASICSLQCLLSFSSFTFTCKYNATEKSEKIVQTTPHLSGWDRVSFLPSSLYSAVFWICDQHSVDSSDLAIAKQHSHGIKDCFPLYPLGSMLGVGKMPGGETARTVDPLSHNRGTAYPMTLCSAIKLDEEEGDSPKKQLLSVAGHQSACRLVSDCFCTSSPLHLFYFLLSCHYLNSHFFPRCCPSKPLPYC